MLRAVTFTRKTEARITTPVIIKTFFWRESLKVQISSTTEATRIVYFKSNQRFKSLLYIKNTAALKSKLCRKSKSQTNFRVA